MRDDSKLTVASDEDENPSQIPDQAITVNTQAESGTSKNPFREQLLRVLEQQDDVPVSATDTDRTLDENVKGNFHGISNEPLLYKTFDYLKEAKGAALGVGLDQMLDIYVNAPGLQKCYLLDITKQVSLVSKAFLEVGKMHFELFHTYPSTDEYLNYFREENLDLTVRLLSRVFNNEELQIVESGLRDTRTDRPEKEDPDRWPISSYLERKNKQPEANTWVSSNENLERVLKGYIDEDVQVVNASLTGEKAVPTIARDLEDKQIPVGVLYLSNIETYMVCYSSQSAGPKYERNLRSLLNEDTLVVRTITAGKYPYCRGAGVPSHRYQDENTSDWMYLVQSGRDRIQEMDAGYSDERKYATYEQPFVDRLEKMEQGEDVGIRIPEEGFYLVGL